MVGMWPWLDLGMTLWRRVNRRRLLTKSLAKRGWIQLLFEKTVYCGHLLPADCLYMNKILCQYLVSIHPFTAVISPHIVFLWTHWSAHNPWYLHTWSGLRCWFMNGNKVLVLAEMLKCLMKWIVTKMCHCVHNIRKHQISLCAVFDVVVARVASFKYVT